MSGISIKLTVDDAQLVGELDAIAKRTDDKVGFFKNVGEQLLGSAIENFDREAGPDGAPWKPLLPSTIKRREEAGLTPIRILRARGRLVGSLNYEATNDQVALGSPLDYAAIQQLGGEIKRQESQRTIYQNYDAETDTLDQKFRRKADSNFARDVKVPEHAINIVARPYIGISKDDEEEIINIAREWLRG